METIVLIVYAFCMGIILGFIQGRYPGKKHKIKTTNTIAINDTRFLYEGMDVTICGIDRKNNTIEVKKK